MIQPLPKRCTAAMVTDPGTVLVPPPTAAERAAQQASRPRTVAVGYPPGYDPGTVAVPPPPRSRSRAPAREPGPLPAAVPATAPRPAQARAALYDSDLGPDVPWGPRITLAQVAELAVSQGVDPATLPPATRAAYEAGRSVGSDDRKAPIRDRARAMLADRLPELSRIAGDSDASANDRIAAIRELGKIADVYESVAPAVTVTIAEVNELLAEVRAAKARAIERMQDDQRVVAEQGGEGIEAVPRRRGVV
jgi:hypothetical protein